MRHDRTLTTRACSAAALIAVLALALASSACAKGGVATSTTPPSLVPANATSIAFVDLAGLASNELLQDDFLARYRDMALSRLGLRVADAQSVRGLVQVFGLPGERLAAFMPGYSHKGTKAAEYRGVALLGAGAAGEVAANVPGGCLIGHPEAVSASLDVAGGRAPWLKGSVLEELMERGAEFKSIRLATTDAAKVLQFAPTPPPMDATAKLQSAGIYVTLDGSRLAVRIDLRCGDPAAATALAAWAEGLRKRFRDKVAGFREMAGLFGGALEPAVNALDAVKVVQEGSRASVSIDHDLRPIFSSGLMTVLKTLQLFGN